YCTNWTETYNDDIRFLNFHDLNPFKMQGLLFRSFLQNPVVDLVPIRTLNLRQGDQRQANHGCAARSQYRVNILRNFPMDHEHSKNSLIPERGDPSPNLDGIPHVPF
ncbi:hypothetical protein, partial [Acinetobacter gyllenbergii]|uniref:hypothetical protein n=1 Tax=Acinetobacter gyllenbergii TaxID=134534 RepID=UPI003AF5380E